MPALHAHIALVLPMLLVSACAIVQHGQPAPPGIQPLPVSTQGSEARAWIGVANIELEHYEAALPVLEALEHSGPVKPGLALDRLCAMGSLELVGAQGVPALLDSAGRVGVALENPLPTLYPMKPPLPGAKSPLPGATRAQGWGSGIKVGSLMMQGPTPPQSMTWTPRGDMRAMVLRTHENLDASGSALLVLVMPSRSALFRDQTSLAQMLGAELGCGRPALHPGNR